MEAELRASWALDLGTGRAATAIVDDLVSRHREPHRRYHTLAHVAHVLRAVRDLTVEVPVVDPVAVRVAAWFHDAVYDPRSSTNEADSAALAERLLPEAGVDPARLATVGRLVRVTATHEPTSEDEAVLVDADLGVLAADPAGYQAYSEQVRAEYAHLDDDTWRAGRTRRLQDFLARPHLFTTAPGHALEARARANISAELRALGGA